MHQSMKEEELGCPSGTRASQEGALGPEVVFRGLRPCRPWREGFGPGPSPWLSRGRRVVPSAAGGPRGPALQLPQQREPDPSPMGRDSSSATARPSRCHGPWSQHFPSGCERVAGSGVGREILEQAKPSGTAGHHLPGGEHRPLPGQDPPLGDPRPPILVSEQGLRAPSARRCALSPAAGSPT